MKKKLLFVLFGICLTSNAQTSKVTFSYDSSGNQTLREFCLGNCPTSKPVTETPKEIEAITEEDLQKFSTEDVISYYPNPVKEELYLKWQLIDENYVSSIQIYGLNGQTIKSYSKSKELNSQNISFRDYPTGVYIVALVYSSGEQKTIKIIKQ
ncbi:T9SS type A sorting domain-containing protein [Flavobacterium sp. LS1R49]|uniref:T9SS type A sorting domain-containing protein n=1 Tax=Flavobacterium shii TaxID=2987687 RepID=A0A9X2ZAF8_9FLAO|nr:T9SS type A sorting domain-containing protein [Flavobacterium shii]MCV9926615.1 T9SS type A sorting domain-containing protein [Flavobacterium shii]